MTADDPIPALDLIPEITEYWDQLVVAVTDVLRSGQFILGPQVAAFEEEIAGYLGVDHAVGVTPVPTPWCSRSAPLTRARGTR